MSVNLLSHRGYDCSQVAPRLSEWAGKYKVSVDIGGNRKINIR